jgi:hypothetical protein
MHLHVDIAIRTKTVEMSHEWAFFVTVFQSLMQSLMRASKIGCPDKEMSPWLAAISAVLSNVL